MPTIFERIIAGEIPCHRVWEDDRHFAFLDINPRVVGHTLVVPKAVTDQLFDLNQYEYRALWEASAVVAAKLKRLLDVNRVCVWVYGFEVPHVHIHLLPANSIEDVPIQAPSLAAKAKLMETAALLRG
jgi:histidine triad (HIT) family protein